MSKKSDFVSAIIVDDDDLEPVVQKKKRTTKVAEPLKKWFHEGTSIEVGIDEAGRGPMFGRVYAGAAVLPKDDSFDHSLMKDSKKFHSKKKIEQVAEYIKTNAVAWAVEYEDERVIDEIIFYKRLSQQCTKPLKMY